MDKYAILLGYFNKQVAIIERLANEISRIDLSIYEYRFMFTHKTQQFYTSVEDLLKQIAKSFENHIDQLHSYHKELILRLHTEIPNIRPAVLSKESFLFLDKLRAFRHFIRHAYDCELDPNELLLIQEKIKHNFALLKKDLSQFHEFVDRLSQAE